MHINVSTSFEHYVTMDTDNACCEQDINSLSFISKNKILNQHGNIYKKLDVKQ
jgi:hypothetical protein